MKKSYTTIAIMGGGLVKDKKSIWRTTNFDEGDDFGISGDRLRVFAAWYLYRENPAIRIIVLGGKGQLAKIHDAVPVSEAMRCEMLALGIPKEKITIETRSGSTYQQLQALKRIMEGAEWGKVSLISNRYHLPRISAMIVIDKELNQKYEAKTLLLEAAEDIVIRSEPHRWEAIIKKAYKSKAMKERIALEQKGVRQIQDGTYVFQ